MSQWQPTTSLNALRQRGSIIKQIRAFFDQRNVLEVETPALSHYSVTDAHLQSFSTEFVGPGAAKGTPLYLQTSPEYAMKRLLAAGSGCIFQIAKAYRNEESGRHHNPEFTLLEWYRMGFDDQRLMQEVDALLQLVLNTENADYISYQEAFIEHLSIDPLSCTMGELNTAATQQGFAQLLPQLAGKDDLLQLLFSHCIEDQIGKNAPCFVYHFPATQAALARINTEDCRVANRFEVYYQGIELANGFHELSDAAEQKQRFEQDNKRRKNAGLRCPDIDPRFIDALNHGLPDCAGVALGIDRLIMLALQQPHIDQVISFPVNIA